MNATSGADTVEFEIPKARALGRPEPYSSLVEVDLGGLSDQGKVRSNNEDHFLACRFGRFLEPVRTNLPADAVPKRSEEGGYAMVVADGMGGSAAGEEASRLAITGLVNLVLQTPDWILRLDEAEATEEVMRRAGARFEEINQAMEARAMEEPGLRGFGTTMTMACSVGRELFIAHIGDSRVYLLRRGSLEQLTRDHTVAQELADIHAITRQEAAAHRLRHVLTRALGDHGHDLRPDVTRHVLDDGDRLLLCTDGLTDMVPGPAIAEILAATESAQAACERLVSLALEAGGKDNVTVVVAIYRLP